MTTRRIGRQSIDLSNLDKVLFPPVQRTGSTSRQREQTAITKGQMIDYYQAIAETMLPHVRERPAVMERYPDGIDAGGFYQKQVSPHFPPWVRNVTVPTSKGPQQQVVCDNAATLVYLANQGVMTLHPWLSRADRLDHPDLLVIDVDPPGDDFAAARWTALLVRNLLEALGATTFARTTGSRGIHVVVPLDRSATFTEVRSVASRMMKWLAARHPAELTTEQRIAKRGNRVYLDVGRNAHGQTAVASYAVRARPGAPVATPVDWSELEEGSVTARTFNLFTILERVKARDDPWSGMRRHALSAKRLAERFAEVAAQATAGTSSRKSGRASRK